MSTILLVAPATEPITLAEVKLNQRVDQADDDAMITSLIVAARRLAEQRTQRQLITAQWRYSVDAWPGEIELLYPPLVSVQSVKYIDADGVLQTLSPSLYTTDTASRVGRIVPAFGTYWPTARAVPNAVQVEYTAGYGVAAAVPAEIKQWMHLAIGVWYENRADLTPSASAQLPAEYASGLLDPYTINKF